MTPRQLRSRTLRKPHHGMRITGVAPATQSAARAERLATLSTLARDDQFFSHSTAALIHGMPLPRRLEQGPVHLASPSFTVRMRRPGVTGHRLKSRVVEVEGMRVESVADTFVHLATQLTLDELVAVGDWIVDPRRPGRLTVGELAEATQRFTGARGMSLVRQALALVREGAESVQETRMRLGMLRAGLPEPVLQHELADARGFVWARLDLSYPELRLAIEYDGEHHRTDDRQYAKDNARIRRLRAEGWYVIRVTKDDLRGGGRAIVAHIRDVHARLSAERAR